jgi:hypothetical protein
MEPKLNSATEKDRHGRKRMSVILPRCGRRWRKRHAIESDNHEDEEDTEGKNSQKNAGDGGAEKAIRKPGF